MTGLPPLKKEQAGREQLAQLPKMVNWYNPAILARTGLRSIISNVFGQYADQRLIQSLTDTASEAELALRYDYSDLDASDTRKKLATDENGAVWVDYAADIGDGFDSTYTIASLLASEQLEVEGAGALNSGEILILGGDQAYPESSREEYLKRFQTPYNFAYDTEEPQRKLFAIPGNHDWYDGLMAFDSLFCSARDQISDGRGTKIGGWECQQHRSYFAIKLPYNWWIWGADIQFSQYLDDGQVNYFDFIARQMGPDDKIILCIAQPNWLEADKAGYDPYSNLSTISKIAGKYGVRIKAAIAGDWHHYNRYYSEQLDLHLITAGGGGAFMHSTHQVKDGLEVSWMDIEEREPYGDGAAQSPVPLEEMPTRKQNLEERFPEKNFDFSLKEAPEVSAQSPQQPEAPQMSEQAADDPAKPKKDKAKKKKTKKRKSGPAVYPSKAKSRWLNFRVLGFPFMNKAYCAALGLIYWITTWIFHSSAQNYPSIRESLDAPHINVIAVLKALPSYIAEIIFFRLQFTAILALILTILVLYVDAKKLWVKFIVGFTHFALHLVAMLVLFVLLKEANNIAADKIRSFLLNFPAIIDFLGIDRRGPVSLQSFSIRDTLGLIYPLEMIPLGGFVAGTIWGLYLFLSCFVFKRHCADTFSALRITDYKNFLKLKIEPHQVSIYPVGINRVPRRHNWRLRSQGPEHRGHNPLYVSDDPIKPFLIEGPVIINAAGKKTDP